MKLALIIISGIFLLFQPLSAQTWTATSRLTWNSGDSYSPAIATDSNNHIHLVWSDDTPGNIEIFYKRSTNSGITWSVKRLSWSSGDSRNPAIAVDSSNNIHVVWVDFTPGNDEIYYKRSTNGGDTWGDIRRLTWSSGSSLAPAIAVDSSNNIHLVWDDDTPGYTEIYYQRSTTGGNTWSGVKRLTWNSGSSSYPVIAVDSGNTIHIVWHDYTPGNQEIFYQKSTNGGDTWGGVKRLTWNSGHSSYPVMAVDSSNAIHLVWHDYTPGNWEICYKKSTNGGGTWASTMRLTWNSGSSLHPTIAADSSNRLYVGWTDFTPGNAEIYYKGSTNSGVTWGSSKRLTWNSGHSESAGVAVDSSKTIYMVWHDYTPGNWEIYYRRGGQ